MAASKNGVVTATLDYEQWLRRQVDVVEADLELKHRQMAGSLFAFLRGTFYRWEPLFKEACGDLVEAPRVLAVGDLHVENFGTWRDREGRLIWGVNDFDEAYTLPYTIDLVRLAASALLAGKARHLNLQPTDACQAVLDGYTQSIAEGGTPFVLGERHTWLRRIAETELRDPVHFWGKMDKLLTLKQEIPASAREALEYMMPDQSIQYRL